MIRASTLLLFLALFGEAGALEPHRFLATHGTLTLPELERLDGGGIVVKVLPASVKNELAIPGTARVRATTEFFLRMYRDIVRFETGWGVTKTLSDPPKIEDFQALQIPEEDWKALRDCKIGDCELN